MSKVRVTNNSEIEEADIARVTVSAGVYRVEFRDGTAKQYRALLLTQAGLDLLRWHAAGAQ
jgi:hypothetical protein